ncbi:MAG: patatin family protein [Brotaphodocola sp.]
MKVERKSGLVLEGGGMRGIYTAGVLDVFMEEGITFDGVIGVSAGAIHGSSYLSGQKGRSIRYYSAYCRDWRFMSMRSLLLTGNIAEVQFCYHILPDKLDPYDYEAFKKNPTRFYVGCSNVETGKPEYLPVTDMKKQIDRIRASASLPLVSKIVETAGMKLLDGGCTDSIPVKAFMKMGYTDNVVVLTRHKGYRKKKEGVGLTKIRYRKYPDFVKAVSKRPVSYNRTLDQIDEWEKKGKIFVIRPSIPLTIGRMEANPDKLQQVYRLGREDARRQMEDLKKWMKNNGRAY